LLSLGLSQNRKITTGWTTGEGDRGATATPKSFALVKIRENSVEILAKRVKTFAKLLYVV